MFGYKYVNTWSSCHVTSIRDRSDGVTGDELYNIYKSISKAKPTQPTSFLRSDQILPDLADSSLVIRHVGNTSSLLGRNDKFSPVRRRRRCVQ
jgi:hypothetical protein